MDQLRLNELEAAMLKKRLKYLQAEGATGKLHGHGLDDDFFEQLEDHWTFCAALSDLYSVKEIQARWQDDGACETLDDEEEENHAETEDLYAPGVEIPPCLVRQVLRKGSTCS